jgi:hypothetical protein
MDSVKIFDKVKLDHHVEGSSTSCNDNFLIATQVLIKHNAKKKRIEDKQLSILIDSLFTMHTSIDCKKQKLRKNEKCLLVGFKL